MRPPALVLVLTAFAWAAIAATRRWPLLFGLYGRRATRWGVLASMIGGLVTSLAWMGAGSPFDVHGFIPGVLVGLVAVSLVTEHLPEIHLRRVWGDVSE